MVEADKKIAEKLFENFQECFTTEKNIIIFMERLRQKMF